MLVFLSCNKDDNQIGETTQPIETQGYKMLLIGSSFFKPYAEKLDDLSIIAGFENHSSTRIIRGGDNGRPINFWNDSNSNEHLQIKAALDAGNIDIFGMTAGNEAEDRTEGHRAWINYALQNNPNIIIFIAIPQIYSLQIGSNVRKNTGLTRYKNCTIILLMILCTMRW